MKALRDNALQLFPEHQISPDLEPDPPPETEGANENMESTNKTTDYYGRIGKLNLVRYKRMLDILREIITEQYIKLAGKGLKTYTNGDKFAIKFSWQTENVDHNIFIYTKQNQNDDNLDDKTVAIGYSINRFCYGKIVTESIELYHPTDSLFTDPTAIDTITKFMTDEGINETFECNIELTPLDIRISWNKSEWDSASVVIQGVDDFRCIHHHSMKTQNGIKISYTNEVLTTTSET